MIRDDEGPFDTVGWGPFALPGERKRHRQAEQRRMAELESMATPAATGEPDEAEARAEADSGEDSISGVQESRDRPHEVFLSFASGERFDQAMKHYIELIETIGSDSTIGVFIPQPSSLVPEPVVRAEVVATATIAAKSPHPVTVTGSTVNINLGGQTLTIAVDPETADDFRTRPDLLDDPVAAWDALSAIIKKKTEAR